MASLSKAPPPSAARLGTSGSLPQITVPEFYPNVANAHFFVIGGNTRCGKTVLLLDIVTKATESHPECRFWGRIILLCPTYHLQPAYREFIPPEWAITKFDIDSVITELLDEQEKKPDDERQRILLIIDDVIGVTNSQALPRLASSGRHYKVDTIILVQHLKSIITPIIRSNASYILCAKILDSSLEVIVDNVPRSICPTRHTAELVVEKLMSDRYRFVGISNDTDDPPFFTVKVDIEKFDPISFQLSD